MAVDARICHACWEAVFATLCYQYRAAIPAAELPAAVTARQDCWYGRECRTQHTKPAHAERLNHICLPMERGKGGKGKGGGGRQEGGDGLFRPPKFEGMDFLDRPNLEKPHKTPTSQAKPGANPKEFPGITG